MRKFLYGLGAVCAVLIVAGGVGLFFLIRSGGALDAESKAYVDDAVVGITTQWSTAELMKRSTSNFQRVTKPDQLEGFFEAAKTALGPLVDYAGAKGSAKMTATVGTGATISATYVAHARFQKGEADVTVTLMKIDGSWAIEGFHISSDLLMSHLTGRKS